LSALADKGVEVYGVEPVETLVMEASRAGLDVRADDTLTHLRALPDDALGGLVLSGCIDVLPIGLVLAVADRAAAVVARGARVVVLSAGPAAVDPVVADIAPGRPLHAETWCRLLAARGLGDVRVVTVGPPDRLESVAPDVPGAGVLNANIERLNRALFASGAYAVVATKR
jgi:hypothetical protein